MDSGGSSLAAATAFLQRMIRRIISSHVRHTPRDDREVDVKTKAKGFLRALNSPSQIAREAAIINVVRDWEVLNDESALIPECLQVQVRVLEMGENPNVAGWARGELGRQPIAKLYKAIVEQGTSDGFDAVKLTMGSPILGEFRRGSHWENVMRIPRNLGIPMLGFATRLRATGLGPMRQFAGWDFISSLSVDISDSEPNVVTLSWTT